MSAPASAVFLFARSSETGTHRVALERTAFAYPETALRRRGQAALILRKFEVREYLARLIAGSNANILIQTIGIDQFAWIHSPLRVPSGLELTKGLDQLRSIHLGQQLAFGLPVTIPPKKSPAIVKN